MLVSELTHTHTHTHTPLHIHTAHLGDQTMHMLLFLRESAQQDSDDRAIRELFQGDMCFPVCLMLGQEGVTGTGIKFGC